MPKLALLGPYPPPFGGVALFLVRLTEALQRRGISVDGLSTGGVTPGMQSVRKLGLVNTLSATPVHIHTDEGNAKSAVLLGSVWKATRRPYAITVHSFRDRADLRHLDQRLARVYQNARLIVAISDEVRTAMHARLNINPSTVQTIPSALPISQWELQHPLPNTIPDAWKNANKRILANAGRVVRYNNQDLYGIDTLLWAFSKVQSNDVSLLVVLGEVIDKELHEQLTNLAARDRRIHLISRLESPLTTITHLAHVVVRPTRTEGGESLTLTEAQELGVWTVGSDAVKRPPGTVLFETANADSLATALTEVLQRQQQPAPVVVNSNAADTLIEAYYACGLLSERHG